MGLLLLVGAFTHKFILVRDHGKPLSWQENMNREQGNRESEKGLMGQWSWRVEARERPPCGRGLHASGRGGTDEVSRARAEGAGTRRGSIVAAVRRQGCPRTGARSEERRCTSH